MLQALTASLVLALSCATAAAAPVHCLPPKLACTAGGDLVFEIQRGAAIVRLYAGGGWTRGGPGFARGCVAPDDVATIRASLANAPWKITRGHADCKAETITTTIFKALGKRTFTDVTCSGTKIDDATRIALGDATLIVDAATARPAPTRCERLAP